MGTIHDHVINFKVDLDVVNEKNSLLEKTTHVREVTHPWLDKDEAWGTTTRQQFVKSRYIETENESRLFYPPNFRGSFAFVNKEETNSWGVPRGYLIHPGYSPIYNVCIRIIWRGEADRLFRLFPRSQTVVGSRRMLNNANFAKYNLAVTKVCSPTQRFTSITRLNAHVLNALSSVCVQRKETEPFSSSAWNHHLPGNPPVDFDKFFDGYAPLLLYENNQLFTGTEIVCHVFLAKAWSRKIS